MSDFFTDIRVDVIGSVGVITLNRPKALNALSADMVCGICDALNRFALDENVVCVILSGSGNKAFCAGGDVKAVYDAKDGCALDSALNYFKDEYALDRKLFDFQKPLIAFVDGICMGGGYGLAAPCDFRVITPRTVFAMPEVKIGFFVDVGSAYYLSRYGHNMGVFAAMTGHVFRRAHDLMRMGVGTHHVDDSDSTDFIQDLAAHLDETTKPSTSKCSGPQNNALQSVRMSIESYITEKSTHPIGEAEFSDCCLKQIEHVFGYDDPWKIWNGVMDLAQMEKDQGDDGGWAGCAKQNLKETCMKSAVLSLFYVRYARDKDYHEIIDRDYDLVKYIYRGDTFYEGVRAKMIDKTDDPSWLGRSLEEYEIDEVKHLFKSFVR